MSTGVNVDQDARDMARAALAQISTHEQVCAERQGAIIKTLCEIKGILKYFATGLITTAFILIGYLYTHPPH